MVSISKFNLIQQRVENDILYIYLFEKISKGDQEGEGKGKEILA